jgi:ABC-type branched-subunit amino acid transport system ATPase component
VSAAVTLEDVRVHFGGVRAVDGVSFRVEEGTLCGLVGPNGSGKTTLLNAISGIGPLTGGRVAIGGEDATRRPAHELYRAGLARTFQSIRLLPALTVRENVLLGADRAGPPSDGRARWSRRARVGRRIAAGRAADAAIARLGLAAHTQAIPAELSYGTQRRVEIARALAGAPRVLLLDEPVAGMNRAEREEIASVIASLRSQERLTQVLIEHDLRMILALCDHMVVLNFGKRIAEGDPHDTAADRAVQEAYLGPGRAVA